MRAGVHRGRGRQAPQEYRCNALSAPQTHGTWESGIFAPLRRIDAGKGQKAGYLCQPVEGAGEGVEGAGEGGRGGGV